MSLVMGDGVQYGRDLFGIFIHQDLSAMEYPTIQ